MKRLKEARGNLWFSTTKTLSPLGKEKVSGLLIFIVGAGPCLGCGLFCACIMKVKDKHKSKIVFFILVCFVFGWNIIENQSLVLVEVFLRHIADFLACDGTVHVDFGINEVNIAIQ